MTFPPDAPATPGRISFRTPMKHNPSVDDRRFYPLVYRLVIDFPLFATTVRLAENGTDLVFR